MTEWKWEDAARKPSLSSVERDRGKIASGRAVYIKADQQHSHTRTYAETLGISAANRASTLAPHSRDARETPSPQEAPDSEFRASLVRDKTGAFSAEARGFLPLCECASVGLDLLYTASELAPSDSRSASRCAIAPECWARDNVVAVQVLSEGAECDRREKSAGWREAEEERAAIVEHDGKIPRVWAEGFARLHPDGSPGDVPLKRWRTFIDDIARFFDSPFCAVASALGWGSYDLFGCDRDRPFDRIDQAGLLWLLAGDKLITLSENTATIERPTAARQTYRRRGGGPGRVLAWELSGDG